MVEKSFNEKTNLLNVLIVNIVLKHQHDNISTNILKIVKIVRLNGCKINKFLRKKV